MLYRTARRARDAAVTDPAATDKDRYDAESLLAFAVGWLTHCETDVTGHPFTNAKSGGPFRDHWQRHHLVELHIDSLNYSANHTGPYYGDIGESAVHFWPAFRCRSDGPYAGRDDGPAYDYFAGFPSYPTGDGPTDTATRKTFFDLDTGDLPKHLVSAVQDATATVQPDGPQILAQDADYCMTDANGVLDGRPNTAAMNEMWTIVYTYLKLTGTSALAPRKPQPPADRGRHRRCGRCRWDHRPALRVALPARRRQASAPRRRGDGPRRPRQRGTRDGDAADARHRQPRRRLDSSRARRRY